MGYKLIPAKHPGYDGLLREETLDLPLGAAIVALRLEEDGAVVINDNPSDGQIQSWRKTCGVTHAFAMKGTEYTALNLMMYNACFRLQDLAIEAYREPLLTINRMMSRIHAANSGEAGGDQ